MSAGAFVQTLYQTDNGDVINIRVQPETLALVIGGAPNAAPPGPTTITDLSASVSRSKRAIGVNARTVSVRFTGALPDGYSGDPISRIPVLNPAVFNNAAKQSAGTYLGVDIQLVGKSAEVIN